MASQKTAAPTFAQSEQNKQDAAKLIAQLPAAALALGALTRGAFGLRDLFASQPLQPPGVVPGTQFIGMPRLNREQDKQKQPKVAADGTPFQPSTSVLGRVTDPAAKWLYQKLLASNPAAGRTHTFDNSINPSGIPYTYSLGLPLAAAAFAGGYGVTDAMLDRRRRAERQQELDKVRAQYMQMLQGKTAADQFDALAEKTAAAVAAPPTTPPQPSVLDMVPDTLRKDVLPQLGGMAGNFYGAVALLSALGAGKWSYDHFRGNSKRKTLEEALRRRAAATSGPGPAMVYAED